MVATNFPFRYICRVLSNSLNTKMITDFAISLLPIELECLDQLKMNFHIVFEIIHSYFTFYGHNGVVHSTNAFQNYELAQLNKKKKLTFTLAVKKMLN